MQNELAIKKNEVEILSSTIVSIVSLDELEKKSGSLAQKALAVKYFMVRLGARPRAFINSTEVFVVRRHYYAPTFMYYTMNTNFRPYRIKRA